MYQFNEDRVVQGIAEDYRQKVITRESAEKQLRSMGLTENQIRTILGSVLLSEHE